MSTDKLKIHPELLKMYNSPGYRKKVKQAITKIKELHNIKNKLKRGFPKLSLQATEKQKTAHVKLYTNKPDVNTAHYFCQFINTAQDRKNTKSADKK